MLSNQEFRKQAHLVTDWIAAYLEKIEQFPVFPQVHPGEIKQQIDEHMPAQGDSFERIFSDFLSIIPKGITHWQHPGFMALFPSNSSYESVLGEFLIAGLGINAMVWETSPAATELEERVLGWLRDAFRLPKEFSGVIQDTASISTLSAIISARERFSNFSINQNGFSGFENLVMYCSDQAHYSVEKGAKAAGIGQHHVRKIKTGADFSMLPGELERQIAADRADGLQPFMAVATLGTTSSLAFDPLPEIGEICAANDMWLHVDAAYAGSAFLLDECQQYLNGIEMADSYVVNAHKWLFTNFDCSLYYVRDAGHLINTFSSNPDYLKRNREDVINYKDWGLALGRRFRALKLWFVIRGFGLEGLQQRLRAHIRIANQFYEQITSAPGWELMAPFAMNVICIRRHPAGIDDEEALTTLNEAIIRKINASGKFYLSGTKLRGRFAIRVVIGQTHVDESHANELYTLMCSIADQ
jgi:aromatic-L-amino-acid decarboxylase